MGHKQMLKHVRGEARKTVGEMDFMGARIPLEITEYSDTISGEINGKDEQD